MSKAIISLFLLSACAINSQQVAANEDLIESVVVQEAPFNAFTAKINGHKVRLRTGPNLEGHVIRETNYGEMFGVVAEENDFYAVQAPQDCKGYIFRTFVLDGVVEGDRVNVRLYPDIDAPTIGKLNRGDQVEAQVSSVNNKWLEIDVPQTTCFYVAKEYLENCGPIEMLATIEARHHEATHHLSAAFHFAQSELQKPFGQIDIESVGEKLTTLGLKYSELTDIAESAHEIMAVMQERYMQKKIAFLESKATGTQVKAVAFEKEHIDRLKQIGFHVEDKAEIHHVISEPVVEVAKIAKATAEAIGCSEIAASMGQVTDKMMVWQPLEESLYHLWVAANGGDENMESFYEQEVLNANVITGIVEGYSRPVKNRPGDFILKDESLPVAFLYSTCVNLEELVGKKVTLRASPRPNNNFAFPAYFVLSVE